MIIDFKYGDSIQSVNVPDKNLIGILSQNEDMPLCKETEESIILNALNNPIGSKRLKDIVKPNSKVIIVTSDITRPLPTYKVMPAILDELYSAGISKTDITLVFALGSHRTHTEEEKRKLAGDWVYSEIECIDSDSKDIIRLGTTKRGTPVDIMRKVAQADYRICLGNIEFHYFAGFSGGAKAIMPGVSSYQAIQANHKFMVNGAACAGKIEGNPVREDIEEAAKICGIDFILNVVLNEKKEIVYAVAGDYIKAHRVGCEFINKHYLKEIDQLADIVLVSPGGSPKDINLYQAQKAIDNAKYAVKNGGVIILIASCKEGLGNVTFENWLLQARQPSDLIDRIKSDFQLGGHKAAAISMVLQSADIYLVSEINDITKERIYLRHFQTAQDALNAAFEKLGQDATVLAMPFGSSTLPMLTN